MEISFHKNLKSLREQRGLKANELAHMFDVAPSTVSAWETGKSFPDLLKLIKICELFNVSLDRMVFGGDDEIIDGLTDLQKFIIKETINEFRKNGK